MYNPALFVILDTNIYNSFHRLGDAQRAWLENDLKQNKDKLIFVFGHEPAYPIGNHMGDSLDRFPVERDGIMSPIFSKRLKKYLGIIFISVSLCFSITFIYIQAGVVKREFNTYFKKSLDEKYTVVDGDFYKFISFCKEKIPPRSEILFYNSWELCKKTYFPRGYIFFEYEKQKARFYLYPIKVLTFPYEDKIIEEQELYYYNKEEMLKRVSFIIAESLDMEFPGFKIKYTYDSDKYILARE